MFRFAQHDSAIYGMSATSKPISCRDVIPWNLMLGISLDVGASDLELPSVQALRGILFQPIPETIEFFSHLRLDST